MTEYYATLDRNGTDGEIVIFAPGGRPMLFLEFRELPGTSAPQLKADALLIVDALNAYNPTKEGI